jgi:hypothetical protein
MTTKHHEIHSPALVSVPEKLIPALKLANLLPLEFRNPYWARKEGSSKSRYLMSKQDILFRYLDNKIPIEDLWSWLKEVLIVFPIELQAFILNDVYGKEDKGAFLAISLNAQIYKNLVVIGKDKTELEEIVKKELKKIATFLDIEEKLHNGIYIPSSVKIEEDIFSYVSPEVLVQRVCQRLIFILSLQEIFSCLIDKDPTRKNQPLHFRCKFYSMLETNSVNLYVDENGYIAFTSPILPVFLKEVEANRIRECQICNQFFWAGRKDMQCCSKKCAHVLRNRNYRKNYPQKYKLQRIKKAEAQDQQNTNKKEKT